MGEAETDFLVIALFASNLITGFLAIWFFIKLWHVRNK